MTVIPDEVAEPIEQGPIPQKVAELPQDTDAPEEKPYLISFEKYNERLCEVSVLSSNKARKAIEKLKIIGTKIHSAADFHRNSIDRIPVRNEGDYKRLYNKLEDDIEIKEIKLQQSARIFYFDVEPKRTFYVVAITENHFETDQVRR